MKITVYETHHKAWQKLDRFYYRNAMAIDDVCDRFTALAKNVEKSMPGSSKEQLEKLAQEFKEVLPQVGKGEKITAPFKLYNCNLGYGLEINYLGEGLSLWAGYFTSPETLADTARDRAMKLPLSYFGVQETPFLYTVTEPYHFSDAEKEKARREYDYEKLDRSQKSEVDATLEAYVECGLDPEERQEFEKAYLKFFN